MKNKITFFCLLCVCILNAQVTIEILNKKIVKNQTVDFVLKNNSKVMYCFLIDTSFSCSEYPEYYYRNSFFSPKIELIDKENKLVQEIIYDNNGSSSLSKSDNSKNLPKVLGVTRSKCGDLKLFAVKPNEILHFKIPLSFVTYLNDNTFKYYSLKRNEYFLQLNYLQGEKFINEKISKRTRDSIADKGIKFFNGELKSNRVKLKIDSDKYNFALKELKNM
ncbi:hypothetical protein ACWA1F_08685 [Flavobacterium sp. 3-218]